jgi:prophage regulatory protein
MGKEKQSLIRHKSLGVNMSLGAFNDEAGQLTNAVNRNKRMLKIADVKKLTGLSRSTIYEYMSKGKFPNQVKLGERCVAWVEEEIIAWIDTRIIARDAANSGSF